MSMKKKILIIEDNENLRMLLHFYLSVSFEVVAMPRGQRALDWLHAGNMPDLVVTDLRMPGLGGEELVQKLKASGFYHDIPIIVLSSDTKSEVVMNCLKAGADDFLSKPFNPEELKIKIDKLLKLDNHAHVI